MRRMKKLIPLAFILLFGLGTTLSSQPRTPQHGQDGDQMPMEESPIGSGIAILLALAGAYGAKKVYDARKKLRE